MNNIRDFTILLLLGILPPLSGQFLNASSMALGVLLGMLMILFSHFKQFKLLLVLDNMFIKALVFLLFYGFFQQFTISLWVMKSYISLIFIFIIIVVALFYSKIITNWNLFSNQVIYSLMLVSFILGLISILTDSELSKIVYGRTKGVFPFGEVSHFALYVGPFFILTFFYLQKKYARWFLLLATFFFAICIESTTLIIYVFLVLLLYIRFSVLSFFIFLPVLLGLILYLLTNEYFSSRFLLSADSINLTALVYLQGITDAVLALKNTFGIGLGFQMLGYQEPSEISQQIAYVLGDEEGMLNRFDGGFLAAKLIAEFGVLGIGIVVGYLYLFVKVYFKLKKHLNKDYSFSRFYLFSLVFIYAIFVEFFVRGVGYFSPSLFLFLVALFIYKNEDLELIE